MKLSKIKARTMMRSVGGCTVPRQNSTSVGMRAAMKASGGSCGEVEGGASRPRLDRPARIKRADGGKVLSKEREDYAKQKDDEAKEARNKGLTGAVLSGVGLGLLGAKSHLAKSLGTAFGVTGGYEAIKNDSRGAERDAKWARSGMAKDGEEDRKRGGRVSDAAQDKKMIASMIHKHESHDHKGTKETKFAKGGSLDGLKDMKKGALRQSLHVKDGEKIPEKKLEKAEHSDNPTLRRRAVLARTMRGWKKG